jgi:hypothetical protein
MRQHYNLSFEILIYRFIFIAIIYIILMSEGNPYRIIISDLSETEQNIGGIVPPILSAKRFKRTIAVDQMFHPNCCFVEVLHFCLKQL